MTEAQEKSFQKIRLHFYKKNPKMVGMYLNIGSQQSPKVLLEFNSMSRAFKRRNGEIVKPQVVSLYVDKSVPKHLINDFQLALTTK